MAAPAFINELTAAGSLSAGAALVVFQSGDTFRTTPRAIITEAESFTPSGSGASARTVQAKVREIEVSITDYGATDSADIVTAFNRIKTAYPNGCVITFPETTNYWLVSSQLVTPDATTYILKGRGVAGQLRKGFSGAMISLGKRSKMEGLYIDGQGATFTGVGVLINTGSLDQTSWRRIRDCDIFDTESYGVEFSGNRAGYGSQISDSRIVPFAESTPAVKFPTLAGASENNGNRSLVNVWTANRPIVDLASGNNAKIVACDGGIPTFTQYTQKVSLSDCRIVNYTGAPTWTIDGDAHSIKGNTISLTAGTNSITFAATLTNSEFETTTTITTTVDNADGSNHITYPQASYTPTWTSGGATAIGDGSLNGSWIRVRNRVKGNIQMTIGGTTNVGSGAWSFTLPLSTAARDSAAGGIVINDGAAAFYEGSPWIQATASTVRGVLSSTTTLLGAAAPITWASGDTMVIDFEYQIAQ